MRFPTLIILPVLALAATGCATRYVHERTAIHEHFGAVKQAQVNEDGSVALNVETTRYRKGFVRRRVEMGAGLSTLAGEARYIQPVLRRLALQEDGPTTPSIYAFAGSPAGKALGQEWCPVCFEPWQEGSAKAADGAGLANGAAPDAEGRVPYEYEGRTYRVRFTPDSADRIVGRAWWFAPAYLPAAIFDVAFGPLVGYY